MGKNRKNKPRLICKNGHWYEDGKLLRRKDYIFQADCHEGEIIITQKNKYRIREAIYV